MGQAAGTAAAICVKRGIEPRGIDVQELRALLRDNGVVIEPEKVA
ncbi:MAG: FAD-dependent oxidoreductase [Candidatus Sigynarchaeota archaeon]